MALAKFFLYWLLWPIEKILMLIAVVFSLPYALMNILRKNLK